MGIIIALNLYPSSVNCYTDSDVTDGLQRWRHHRIIKHLDNNRQTDLFQAN